MRKRIVLGHLSFLLLEIMTIRGFNIYSNHSIQNLYKTTRTLIPEQYNITIAMQYSVVEMHYLIKKISLLIFRNMVYICILVLAKNHFIFLPPSRLHVFAYLDFVVLKKRKNNFLFDYLPQPCKIGLGRIREPINQVTVALLSTKCVFLSPQIGARKSSNGMGSLFLSYHFQSLVTSLRHYYCKAKCNFLICSSLVINKKLTNILKF